MLALPCSLICIGQFMLLMSYEQDKNKKHLCWKTFICSTY